MKFLSAVSRSVFAIVLTLLAVDSRAATVIGEERPVAPLTFAPSLDLNATYILGIATDGTDFLVLLHDMSGVYASLVSGNDGSLRRQVRVAQDSLGQVPARGTATICWTGSTYVTTWIAFGHLIVATINRDGSLASAPRDFGSAMSAVSASNGRRVLIATIQFPGVIARGYLLDDAGNVLRSDITLPASESQHYNRLAIATDGDDFLVAAFVYSWPSTSHAVITATIISREGVVGENREVTAFAAPYLAAAFARGRYVVAATDENGTTRRFVINANAPTRQLPDITAGLRDIALTTDGSNFVLFAPFAGGSGLYAATFTGDAEATPPVLKKYGPGEPSNAPIISSWNGSRYLVATGADRLAFLDPAFTPSDSISIARSPQYQDFPAVASGDAQRIIIWVEPQTSRLDNLVRGTRANIDGTPIDREPFTIASNVAYAKPTAVLARGGYFVVWSSPGLPGVTYGRRVNFDATLGPIVELGAGRAAAAASNGREILVAFENAGVRAVRLTADGEPIDQPAFSIGPSTGRRPRVASNGEDFLVAWVDGREEYFYGWWFQRDVFAARVLAGGAVDTPMAVASGAADENLADVSSDGRDYLVVYSFAVTNGYAAAAKRVSRAGMVLDATPAEPGVVLSQKAIPVSVTGTSNGYDVTLQSSFTYSIQLSVVRTTAAGVPIGSPDVVAESFSALGIGSKIDSAISFSGGRIIVAYSRVVDAPDSLPAIRVFQRTLFHAVERGRTAGRR